MFIKHATGYEWKRRKNSDIFNVDEDLIQSGDYFAVTRMDGLDQIIEWGTGSHSGHSVIALRIDGELYITESQDGWYWPKHGIQRNLFKDWVKYANNAGFNVVWLPLRKELREKFNETAAVEFFKSVEGLPYGYHNFLFSWLDTPDQSFPKLLSTNFAITVFSIMEKISFL